MNQSSRHRHYIIHTLFLAELALPRKKIFLASAECYAENAGFKRSIGTKNCTGWITWYNCIPAKGDDSLAKAQWDYLRTIR